MNKTIAIIPARGGSKRIPQKNIKDFLGKPIIAYPIEVALKSKLFDEVMVSTDNDKIAKIAQEYGATVPFFRSKKNSDDFAILNDVFEEVKREYKKNGVNILESCLILPTSPLISVFLLQKTYKILKNNNFDSVRPIVRFSYPIQRAFKLSEKGKVDMINPEFYKTRTQDLEVAYHDAGQFYWINKNKTLLNGNKGAYEIKEIYAQDIDNEIDWKLAELKYKLIKNG